MLPLTSLRTSSLRPTPSARTRVARSTALARRPARSAHTRPQQGAGAQLRDGLAAIAAPGADRVVDAAVDARLRADAESLHQLRVYARRLRAALSLFREGVSGHERKALRKGLRWLLRETGPARDCDVLVDETLREAARHGANTNVKSIVGSVTADQASARRRATSALASRKYSRLISDLKIFASGCRRRERRGTGEPLHKLVSAVLRKHHKKYASCPTPSPSSMARSSTACASASGRSAIGRN